MRFGFVIPIACLIPLLLGVGVAHLHAADETAQDSQVHDSQVHGAVIGAVGHLLDELSAERLTPDLTVGEFLRRTNGADQLARTLERGELLGGPRWLDKNTCQVQLEISGRKVLAALKEIAANNPRTSPLPPQAFDRLERRWRDHDFTAIGTTTTAVPTTDLRPHSVNGPWARVRDEDRVQAIADARKDAVQRIIASLRPIRLSRTVTVGDVLDRPGVRRAMEEWLADRPVTGIEFRRDLQVELSLNVAPVEALQAFRSLTDKAAPDLRGLDIPPAADEPAWAYLRGVFERHMASPIGCGAIPVDVVGRRPVAPPSVPGWAETRVEDVGIATLGESKLKSALRAEARAREKLRERIESLSLSSNQTIGQAATQDARLRDAVSRAVSRATIEQTDYDQPPGSVSVHVALDLHVLWEQMTQ
jgi:hypothetical protein